jgi:SSS family solute:Na+ symporter
MKSKIDILEHLTSLDWIVFFFIIILTIGSVLYGQGLKNKKSSERESFIDLMLMGRSLTLPMFIATLVATWYGGIFGVSQIAFDNGIYNFVTQGFFWYLAYIVFALFITKKLTGFEAMTLPDLAGQMFGPKSSKLVAILNILNLVPVVYAISIGLLIQMLFGYPLAVSIIVGITFVLAYSLFGGFRAVVFSDLIQFFVMCVAVVLTLVFSIDQFGFEALNILPDSYFKPMGKYGVLETLSWGLIAVSTLVDPNFYQRSFAAKDFKVAKKGILISTAIWIIFDLCLTFGAMYAKAIIPEADSSHAYFIYALQLLPEGLRGLFLAGIAATILSTLDSYIFLAGSTIAYDLVPKKLKGKVGIHHLGVISVGILSIIMATIFEGNIKNVWKTLGSLSSAALLIPILYGYLFPKRLKDKEFICASLAGIIVTIVWRLGGYKYTYNLDEIYTGSLACLITILLFHFRVINTSKKEEA